MDKDDWRIVKQRFAFPAASLNGLSKGEVEGDLEGMRKKDVVIMPEDVNMGIMEENVQQQGGTSVDFVIMEENVQQQGGTSVDFNPPVIMEVVKIEQQEVVGMTKLPGIASFRPQMQKER
jgi:hypothetical protein